MTRGDIAAAVWNNPKVSAGSAVSSCVSTLRSKLEAAGEARVLHSVRGEGYVLRPGTYSTSRTTKATATGR
jgi:DNA-binding response OmpR family regulator